MGGSYTRVIIDAMDLLHRGWWSRRGSLSPGGRDNSVEAGFLPALAEQRARHPAAELVLAWDGRPSRQLALFPEYKASRAAAHADRPADWQARCDRLRRALSGVLPALYDPEDEADVEIARLVGDGAGPTLIVSGDGDLLALLSGQVSVLRPGPPPRLWTPGEFLAEHGFPPAALPLFRALTGDRSDSVRGLPYFPRKAAAALAAAFGTAGELYRALARTPAPAAVQALSESQ